MGQLRSFARVDAHDDGWDVIEKAHLLRCVTSLQSEGAEVEAGFGVAEDGDPWFSVSHPATGETMIHISRIDGRLGAWDDDHGFTDGRDIAGIVDAVLADRGLMQSSEMATPVADNRQTATILSMDDFIATATGLATVVVAWELVGEYGTLNLDLLAERMIEADLPLAADVVEDVFGLTQANDMGIEIFPGADPAGSDASMVSVSVDAAPPEKSVPGKDEGDADLQAELSQSPAAVDLGPEERAAILADPDGVRGTDAADELVGTSGDDRMFAGAGDDTLEGLDGDDVLFGEAGDDLLLGGAGDDLLLGGSGDDVLVGGAGNDSLDGGTGTDTLFGGAGDDLLVVVDGDDLLIGGAGSDVFDLSAVEAGAPQVSDFELGSDVLISGGVMLIGVDPTDPTTV
ncbi:MAG: hypothetical protein NXI16_14430 [Alphaproteobacteria bacterium]|nr:hypothetical protein [Alphaproteobacteria bacterium]